MQAGASIHHDLATLDQKVWINIPRTSAVVWIIIGAWKAIKFWVPLNQDYIALSKYEVFIELILLTLYPVMFWGAFLYRELKDHLMYESSLFFPTSRVYSHWCWKFMERIPCPKDNWLEAKTLQMWIVKKNLTLF